MNKGCGLILAGGKSSRMGSNKAFLEIGGKTFLERIIESYRQSVEEIIIVTNEPQEYEHTGLKLVTDIYPGQGPLSGIHAGLVASSFEQAFVVACDMPFVDKERINYLFKQFDPNYDALVPRMGEYLQPLFAIYRKSCLQPIEACLLAHQHKIKILYEKVKVQYIDTPWSEADNKAFINVNTPEEFKELKTRFDMKAQVNSYGSKS